MFKVVRVLLLLAMTFCLLGVNCAGGGGSPGDDYVYEPNVEDPTYPNGDGSTILMDIGHDEYHTIGDSYEPFADFLSAHGYQFAETVTPLDQEDLSEVILVIAIPQMFFSIEEITALTSWVFDGGSLFLIVEHDPYTQYGYPLAYQFGADVIGHFVNVAAGNCEPDDQFCKVGVFMLSELPEHPVHPITEGIDHVRTFTGTGFTLDEEGVDALSLLTFGPNMFADGVSAEGLSQGAIIHHGFGRVYLASEGGMFTDNFNYGFHSPMAEFNETYLINIIRWLDGIL